jgi:peptidyl-prolyl cis-trans isomerase D
MAAIGKIRSWGPTLVIVIGLALFAFIAEEMFRSCEASKNQQRQQIGEVLGEKINVQEFQALYDEYQQVIKMTQGRDNLSEDEQNQVKDQVWNTFVNNKIIEAEAEKLGLTVTDEEMQNMLREGTNPMLMQTPFVNQQTGRFDASQLTKFINDYKNNQNAQLSEQYKTIYDYWKFIEKNLRQQTLMQKYQALLSNCLLSNPVSAKAAYEAQSQESNILLAALPYNSVKDDEVQVSDADIKAKYNDEKEMFKQMMESRDIKYVDFQVIASQSDRDALMKTMQDASQKLQSGAAPAEIVRKAQSQIPYLGLPVNSRALPSDIARRIDSMAVGQTTAPFETTSDNTLNVVKLISKQQLPDSVEFRMIQVGGATEEAAQKTADSIYTALKTGVPFDSIAKKYGQTGAKQWLTSAQYQNSTSMDNDSKEYLLALNTMPSGELKNLKFSQGNVIVQVTDRRAMTTKYDVAIIKHTIDFSKQTYSDAYNKFSQFVSENTTIEALEKNAAAQGYSVRERNDIVNSEHNVVGVRATRETMKWIFDAKPGQVSPLYECGSNDHLLVVALTKIHPAGYRDLDGVKEEIKQQVIRDKKFEVLKNKLSGVKSVADAKAKGAVVDSVKQVSFSSPAFIQATGSSEPALAGAVAATKAGEFHANPVKGNGGAFVFQVLNVEKSQQAFDAKASETQLKQRAMQAASRFMQELYQKANITDNRYLFF